MIKIMVGDPDPFAHEGIKEMLSPDGDIEVFLDTYTVAETLEGLLSCKSDVCILEMALAAQSGLQLIRMARNVSHGIPLLVMSGCSERDFGLRAMRAGAAGFLPKDCTQQQLALAVRTVAEGRPYVSETLCELIVESIVHCMPKRPHDRLSDTDFEVLCLMAEGIPTSRIATVCELSIAAVRNSKHRIMQTMSLHREAELIEYAVRRKLVKHAWHPV